MSKSFNANYINLLHRQVEEEIQYLESNNHNTERNYIPCMFCIERPQGHYICPRLNELRRFLASIVSHGSSNPRKEHERKHIGFEAEVNQIAQWDKLPLLSVKL